MQIVFRKIKSSKEALVTSIDEKMLALERRARILICCIVNQYSPRESSRLPLYASHESQIDRRVSTFNALGRLVSLVEDA